MFVGTTKIINARTNFTVTLSTFSTLSVWVTLRALPVDNYFLKTNVKYNATFSPSEPVYYAYQFPDNDVKTVHLQVTSDDDVCFTVSVQPHIVRITIFRLKFLIFCFNLKYFLCCISVLYMIF